MATIKYNGIEYRTREFTVINESGSRECLTIAGEDLNAAITGEDGEIKSDAEHLDNDIYHYVDDINADPVEICLNELDVPFEFLYEDDGEEFELHYDTKETVWFRKTYTVVAHSQEKAVELLRRHVDGEQECDEIEETVQEHDYMGETADLMTPEENGGSYTQEILQPKPSAMVGDVQLWTNQPPEDAKEPVIPAPSFPNVFDSWQETHFEIVSAITDARNLTDDQQPALIRQINDTQGTGGFYQLAKELTDKFEAAHIGNDWDDSEYWESMEGFIGAEIYKAI